MYASQRAEKVKSAKANIGFQLAGPEDLVDKVQEKLVGEAGSDVSAGLDEDHLTSDDNVPFSNLRGESLGSIKSSIYWNSQQYDCVMNPFPKIAIIGEYGTGKNLYLYIFLFEYHPISLSIYLSIYLSL